MRSYAALEGKGEPPRTGIAAGRAQGVGDKMFQDAKSPLDGNIRDVFRAESTAGSALRRQLRTQAQTWGGENTFHDANRCAHQV
jgi:hypothetical protein